MMYEQYDEDEEEEEENEEPDVEEVNDSKFQSNNELLQTNNIFDTSRQEKSRVSIAPQSPILRKKRHRRYISISKGMEMEMEDNVGF